MPKPVYKLEQVEAWWDVPAYADHQVQANRVDARFVNHVSKKVMTIEMSCPWISNRERASKNYEVWSFKGGTEGAIQRIRGAPV